MPIETIDRWVPLPPISMKLTTALHVLCMILSEPAATACIPGETPIETISISTPLAAKKPFLVATIPGHIVAVGETWPKETLLADCAGAAVSTIACSASTAGRPTLSPTRILALLGTNSDSEVSRPREGGDPYSRGQRVRHDGSPL